jgi:hypothetical protein
MISIVKLLSRQHQRAIINGCVVRGNTQHLSYLIIPWQGFRQEIYQLGLPHRRVAMQIVFPSQLLQFCYLRGNPQRKALQLTMKRQIILQSCLALGSRHTMLLISAIKDSRETSTAACLSALLTKEACFLSRDPPSSHAAVPCRCSALRCRQRLPPLSADRHLTRTPQLPRSHGLPAVLTRLLLPLQWLWTLEPPNCCLLLLRPSDQQWLPPLLPCR